MRYPRFRIELLSMLEEDQQEVRACSKKYRRGPRTVSTYDVRDRFIIRSQERVKRTEEILDEIGAPTIENVGADGSQAISVLALHARLSDMKKILASFEASYKKGPASVYHEAIPSLTDRILLIERKKQRFGTQWMLGADGKFFLPPVEDFEHLSQRRAAHGLGKSMHPIDLTDGVPEHEPPRPETRASDQRPPTEREYQDFVYGSLD
jgi:hypothetical protein